MAMAMKVSAKVSAAEEQTIRRKGAGTRFGATREIFFGFCMYRLEEESDLVFDISLEVF
jgi:hypothetical protein